MIVDSELQFFRASVITDTSSNGYVMSPTSITTNTQQNVFPHVFKAERDAGDTKYRKIFTKVSNTDSDILYSATCWLDNQTPADDWLIMFAGTDTDTQGDIVGTEDKFGCGLLNTDVVATGSTLLVDVEDSTLVTGNDAIFRAGMSIGITNKATPDAVAGTTEIHTVLTATPNGVGFTLVLDGTTLANAYTVAEGTRVFGVMDLGYIVAEASAGVVTSTAGTFDDTTYPIEPDNIGSVNDAITLTFSDSSNYAVTGARLGSLGSGIITSDFAPDNSDFTRPYFTIPYLAFGGSFVAGDTITFNLTPASVGIWEKRVVPTGCASLAGNNCVLVFTGEAA